MKVLYDYQAFDMQDHGGVSRCFAELYSHRPETLEAEIAVKETDNVYLQALGFPKRGDTYREFMNLEDSKLKHLLFKLSYNIKYSQFSRLDRNPKLNICESVYRLKKGDYDVFHPTFFDGYFLDYIGNRPFVVTIHDMIPELFPNYFPKDDIQILQKKAVIPKATHFIAVSEQTKKDFIAITGTPEDKVSVVYHGADEEPYVPSENVAYDYEYILYIGTRYHYKNFAAFCRDCLPILKRHPDLKVICTGVPFKHEELYFFDAFGVRDRFVHRFADTQQELMDLYHNAVAFVYPSQYEGFGIPILEAYKADCPVLLNDNGCFREIAGDAAVFFRMNGTDSDFEETFETFYHLDSNEKTAMLKKQRRRLKDFSWNQSAQTLKDVYQKLK